MKRDGPLRPALVFRSSSRLLESVAHVLRRSTVLAGAESRVGVALQFGQVILVRPASVARVLACPSRVLVHRGDHRGGAPLTGRKTSSGAVLESRHDSLGARKSTTG